MTIVAEIKLTSSTICKCSCEESINGSEFTHITSQVIVYFYTFGKNSIECKNVFMHILLIIKAKVYDIWLCMVHHSTEPIYNMRFLVGIYIEFLGGPVGESSTGTHEVRIGFPRRDECFYDLQTFVAGLDVVVTDSLETGKPSVGSALYECWEKKMCFLIHNFDLLYFANESYNKLLPSHI